MTAAILAAGMIRGDGPPPARSLEGLEAAAAEGMQSKLQSLQEAGRFEEALKVAEKLLDFRERRQGKEHWETVEARWDVEALRRVLRCEKKDRESYVQSFVLVSEATALEEKRGLKQAAVLWEKVLRIRRQVLGEDHPLTANTWNTLGSNLHKQARYKEADGLFRKALDIRRRSLGEEHPDTATSHDNVAVNLEVLGSVAEAEESHRQALRIDRKVLGDDHPLTAMRYANLAENLKLQGRYKDAEPLLRKALEVRRKALGEETDETAQGYNNLAGNLQMQARYMEAEDYFLRALRTIRRLHGEDHTDTALVSTNYAANLRMQGKYREGEELLRKAVEVFRKITGETHPLTATGYNNLAENLHAQGRYSEAAEYLYKALVIRRKVFGDEHPLTALAYDNLGVNLNALGRYREAEEALRRALDLRRLKLGEDHAYTANSYNNLAVNLQDQGRYKEAEEGYRKALEVRRKVFGEFNLRTAESYNNLAAVLSAQRHYKEADTFHRQAIEIKRKQLGENHPQTAMSYHNAALNLSAAGRYQEAEELDTRALGIRREVLGEKHPDTALGIATLASHLHHQGKLEEAEKRFRLALDILSHTLGEEHPRAAVSFGDLAANLYAQGRYKEAEELYLRGADAFLACRLRIAGSGLGRTTKTTEGSPLLFLAAVLARHGKPEPAWERFEQSAGRGAWDDLSARLRRPTAEVARETELVARLERLDELLGTAQARDRPTPQQQRETEALLERRVKAREELAELTHHLEKTYGPAAGQVFHREKIQAELPADTALVAWIDVRFSGSATADRNEEHWAVLLRSRGAPVWERLHGSGPGGAWTAEDNSLPGKLGSAMRSSESDWQPLAEKLRAQRLSPLEKHLAAQDGLPAVRRLIVLPSSILAGVPVEVFSDRYTVSYALSGTLYAHLRSQPRPKTEGLLVVADPVFQAPDAPTPPLPPGGLLVTTVLPGSNAEAAHLERNDVLLRYNGIDLKDPRDLKIVPESDGPDQQVPIRVWRQVDPSHGRARTLDLKVRSGKLGVVLAEEPAPEVLVHRRATARGGEPDQWDDLPGTRYEAEALRRLIGDGVPTKVLLDSEASEQALHDLAASGELGKYRYLHFATHGDVDEAGPLRSAIILSRDKLPDPRQQLQEGLPVYDGRLTAREVLEQWQLRADLVTLSACETALGKYEQGEGFIGFAHALMLAGSRSVCLSLWKVDDTATGLLMQRFYENLLGKRDGGPGALPKAQALAEAKRWLRELSQEEALKLAGQMSKGVTRAARPALPRRTKPPAPPPAKGERPFAHPHYWAAFVLIGDPE
jgi:tetratricopeptide (TPR) repeat protein